MHSAIIVLSTSKPAPEDMRGIEDCIFEDYEIPSIIDYIGDDYTAEDAGKFLSIPCRWYTVSQDRDTLVPMSEKEFKPLFADNVRQAADRYEHDDHGNYSNLIGIAKYGSEDMYYRWFYINGEFLTLPQLVQYYGGMTLYINGLTDYHI